MSKLHGPEGLTILVNSRLLAVACHTDHTVRLFSLDNGEEVARMTGGNGSEHQGDRRDSSLGNSDSNFNRTRNNISMLSVKEEVKEVKGVKGVKGEGWKSPVGVASFVEKTNRRRDVLYVTTGWSRTSDAIIAFDVEQLIQSENEQVDKAKITIVRQRGQPWIHMKELKGPAGMDVMNDGESIFVASYQSHRVLVYMENITLLNLVASLRL